MQPHLAPKLKNSLFELSLIKNLFEKRLITSGDLKRDTGKVTYLDQKLESAKTSASSTRCYRCVRYTKLTFSFTEHSTFITCQLSELLATAIFILLHKRNLFVIGPRDPTVHVR